MRITYKFWLIAVIFSFLLCPCVLFAVDDFVAWKDVQFKLKGDYEAYGKYFKERDINSYNGNATAIDPLTGEERRIQTDKVEAWMQHELRLYPSIVFNDKLQFNMRLDVGKYLFQSDAQDRLYTINETTVLPDDTIRVKDDYEKMRVEEAYLQMITPVGLFIIGRFNEGNHGLVYAIQLPQVPGWTFAIAWNKKNEGKLDSEEPWLDYLNTPQVDYMDRDDLDEIRVVTVYESEDKSLYSEQWVDFRLGRSQATAKGLEIALPQWKFEYNKDNLHWKHAVAVGFGTLAEITKTSTGADLQALIDNGKTLIVLNPALYDFPDFPVKDFGACKPWYNSTSIYFTAGYDIGKATPELGIGRCTGADEYNGINGFWWEETEPEGYRTPRNFKTLLIGEIENKYFPLLSTIATNQAFDQNDIAFHNMTFGRIGCTYRMSDKWELYSQVFSAWRTNTTFFKRQYWDFFPIQYALANMSENSAGETIVPFVFQRKDTQYSTDVDNYLGTELNTRVTYKLFPGLDVSLLGAYFFAGDFYEDVLTPKPYVVQKVNTDTLASDGPPFDIKGPYGFNRFDLQDAWTLQLKIDFKWQI